MKNSNLKLIKGGLDRSAGREIKYISGYVTNTRLMGVVCMYTHWYEPYEDEDFHQFFYFDCEENGFEDYKSIRGNDAVGISIIEAKLAGGLGGENIDISRIEAESLLGEYVYFNRKRGIPLPGDVSEYEFMLREDVEISGEEKEKLFAKLCGPVDNRYQAINYFLMKSFAHDYQAARYLCSARVNLHVFDEYKNVTFYKNTIDGTETPDVYMCESLIESRRRFYLVTSEISMNGNGIEGIRKCTSIKLSLPEVNMIMSKPEYITVYDIVTDCDMVDDLIKRNVIRASAQSHNNGNCYIVYNKNNDHVSRRVFWLNEDVYGIYFVSVYNELIACSYHEDYIDQMEIELAVSEIGSHIRISSRYEFKDPVLNDFMLSDFEDFEDFVEFMSGFEDK